MNDQKISKEAKAAASHGRHCYFVMGETAKFMVCQVACWPYLATLAVLLEMQEGSLSMMFEVLTSKGLGLEPSLNFSFREFAKIF